MAPTIVSVWSIVASAFMLLSGRTTFAKPKSRSFAWLSPVTKIFAGLISRWKRADLFFTDLERLRAIRQQVGPLQIVYGGKAHPWNLDGKAVIRKVFEAAAALRDSIPVVYLENYDILGTAPNERRGSLA